MPHGGGLAVREPAAVRSRRKTSTGIRARFDSDVAALQAGGVDIVYAPDVATMYPPGFATSVDPGDVGERYEARCARVTFAA